MTAREIKLITKTCKQYRAVSYGQFDQETSPQPEETKDAAEALEFLIEECAQRRRDFQNLMAYLSTSNFEAPDYAEQDLIRMEMSGI